MNCPFVIKKLRAEALTLLIVLKNKQSRWRTIAAVTWVVSLSAQSQINGLSFEGPPEQVGQAVFEQMVAESRAGCVSLHPYAYGRFDSSELTWQGLDWQWWGEGPIGTSACIRLAKAAGLNVMLKPHVWFRKGEYTGKFKCRTEADWRTFESRFEEYILFYAQMAQSEGVDFFCIGNEWGGFVVERPEFWEQLAAKVNRIYTGPITYAANWDDFLFCPLWDAVDFIGINAYFPVSEDKTPRPEELAKSWKKTASVIQKLSASKGKRVIFTEYGYRSTDYCAREPWDSSTDKAPNDLAQSEALEALFDAVRNKPWYAGGFLWKWHADTDVSDIQHRTAFSVQGKPALEIIKREYAR